MRAKKYFPLFVDLSQKQVVMVGGGRIATRRVKSLLLFTRNITVVAPEATPELEELSQTGQIRLCRRAWRREDFTEAYLVCCATNDRKADDDIYRICRQEGIYVNIASDREKCDFHFPGIISDQEMTIGINASGLDHARAKQVREAIEKCLKETKEEDAAQ